MSDIDRITIDGLPFGARDNTAREMIADLTSVKVNLFDAYEIGGMGAGGNPYDIATRVRSTHTLRVPAGAVVECDASVEYRIGKYSDYDAHAGTFVGWLNDWSSAPITLTTGDYIRIIARYAATPSGTITDAAPFVDLINVRYTLDKSDVTPLRNLYLSVMGDSISAISGRVPEGYHAYYSGANHGVTDVTQMWWSVLCAETGMIPLNIVADSGSGITQLNDPSHIDRIPFSNAARCSLVSGSYVTPDIIIVAGGLNDFTYAAETANEPLVWDGTTAPAASNNFTEAYAVMIKQLQAAAPRAVIVCLSTWFSLRGDDNGYTRTHTANSHTYTQDSYDKTIESVCNIMGAKFLRVNDIGFNRENFYPDYAEDSATIPTHPNANGHRIMGRYIARNIVNAVQPYLANKLH